MKSFLALAAIGAIPFLLLGMIVHGLSTGVIRTRGGPLARADHPIFFWVMIGLYSGCIGTFVYFVGGVALNVLRSL
jgi:hypothetical protein